MRPVTTQVAIDHDAYPLIWNIADSLAKSMYAAISTDFGQITDTSANVVLLPEALRCFSSNFTWYMDTWKSSSGTGNATLSNPGPAESGFDPTHSGAEGPLGITPSVISTKYVCQISQKRSSGSIVLSIILANLVLLQAAWKLYVLIMDWALVSRIPGSNSCEACGKGAGEKLLSFSWSGGSRLEESIELLAHPDSTRTVLMSPSRRPGFEREDTEGSWGLYRPQSLS